MKRIVTYDVKEGNDYNNFYAYVDKVKGVRITESTYELDTSLSQEQFEVKINSLFNKGDNVSYISVNKKNELYYKKLV